MFGVSANVGKEAPAAFAFRVGADFDGGDEVGAAGEVEVAEDGVAEASHGLLWGAANSGVARNQAVS